MYIIICIYMYRKALRYVLPRETLLTSNESEANFQDLGYNADLYIFNQDDRQD